MNLPKLNIKVNHLETIKDLNPVRFALIKSMHQRLINNHQNNQTLFKRIEKHIDDYIDDFEPKHKQTSNTFSNFKQFKKPVFFKNSSNLTVNTSNLFKRVKKVLKQIKLENQRKLQLYKLRNLSNQITNASSLSKELDSTSSIDEILYQQEDQTRIQSGYGSSSAENISLFGELHSMKYYRESIKKLKIDKIISHAINNYPENAGPHNPHMLAIKSLERMTDISPQYLRRFTTYIETILWFELNAKKLN